MHEQHSGGQGRGLLDLTQGWQRNPEAFARPGPPPAAPLPLKFTCRGCGGRVDPKSGACTGCPANYEM